MHKKNFDQIITLLGEVNNCILLAEGNLKTDLYRIRADLELWADEEEKLMKVENNLSKASFDEISDYLEAHSHHALNLYHKEAKNGRG